MSNALLHRRQPEREPQRCSESRPSGDPIYLRASNLASVPALAKRAGTRSAWCLHTGGFQNEHPCQDRPYKYKYSTRAHSLATHGQTRVTPTPCLRSAQAASLVVRLWPQQGPTSVWLASCLSMKLPCACTQVCKHPYKNLDLRARRQVGTLGFVRLGTTDLQIFDFIRRARLRAPRCR